MFINGENTIFYYHLGLFLYFFGFNTKCGVTITRITIEEYNYRARLYVLGQTDLSEKGQKKLA